MTTVLTKMLIFSAFFVIAIATESHSKAHHLRHHPHIEHTLKHHHHLNRHHHANVKSLNSSSSEIEIIYVEEKSFVTYVNNSANAAVIYEAKTTLTAFLNGETGTAVVFNAVAESIVVINGTWSASNQTIAAYIESVSSLQIVVGNAQAVNISAVEDSTLSTLTIITKNLGIQAPITKIYLGLMVVEKRKLSELLSGPLKGLISGNGTIALNSNKTVTWVDSVTLGLGILVENVPGGLEAALNGSHLDLQAIYNANSGLEVVLVFLTQIGQHQDLAKLFGSTLNDPLKFLKVISSFGLYNGVDGLLNIVYNIVALAQGQGSLEGLIDSILQYSANGGVLSIVGPDLTEIVNDFLNLVSSQDKIYHNAGALDGFVRFLKLINSNNFIVGTINVSEIIQLIRSGNFQGGIELSIKIFIKLGGILNPANAAPQLFKQILGLLNGSLPIGSFSHLFPNINISNFGNASNILQTALHGFNLSQILGNNSDVSQAFSHIPIVGDIFKEITTVFGGGFDISKVFNASSILSTFEHVLGGSGIGGFFQTAFSNITTGIEQGIHGIEQGIEGFLGGFGGQHSETTAKPQNRQHHHLRHHRHHEKRDFGSHHVQDKHLNDEHQHIY